MRVIREIISREDADIIALQEIGSLKGARNVLGEEYAVRFETRCGDEAACAEDRGEIFTAIAWKKKLPISVEPVFLDALSEMHHSNCEFDEPRPVRGGVGLAFEYDGMPYTILSVHLKA